MHVLCVVNNANPAAYDACVLLGAYFSSQGISHNVVLSPDLPTPLALATNQTQALENAGVQPCDMVVVLGGDGTVLRSARIAMLYNAPILGINFGHLGFLANPFTEGVVPLVAAALAGDVTEDERAALCVHVLCAEGETLSFTALNEVTIARGLEAQNMHTHVSISGNHVFTLRGDGVIISTPTGSSAYALSAGGPLVSPEVEGMVVVPLPTHSLKSRPIVTSRSDVVEARFDQPQENASAHVQLDGSLLHVQTPVNRVVVRVNEMPARLLFYKKESFYSRISRTFFS